MGRLLTKSRVMARCVLFSALAVAPATGQSESRAAPTSTTPTSFPAHGLDGDALDRLLERAHESQSDAVVIVKDGKLVGEWYFGKPRGPIEAMSATKSIVGLAVGRLLADGRLESLDVPLHRFYPEWNQGRKAKITVRHLLTQRSGLQSEPITTEIYRSPDFVQLALAAELVEDPGAKFRYNNKACNLLAGVVQNAAGMRMDVLIGEEVFKPLGITDWSWSLDRAGNPHGMSGLQIHPADLAKIGRLMLDGGTWEGKRILPESFVAEAVRDDLHPRADARIESVSELWGMHYGLLWWVNDAADHAITDRLLDEWRKLKAPEEFVTKLAELRGVRGLDLYNKAVQLAGGEEKWASVTWQANRPDFDVVGWTSHGYSADGYLGQYLVVVPQHKLIAVRMRRSPPESFDERRIDQFRDFKQRVQALVKS